MTNKELLDRISEEMKDLHKVREMKLEEIRKSNSSDELKEKMRQRIMDNFYASMEEFKKRPGYTAALETARHERSLWGKLRKIEHEKKKVEKAYEDAQLTHRGKKMDQETIDKLYGNKDKIIAYLKDNCLEPCKKVDKHGVNCTRYCLNLPAVNGFNGKPIEWFTSDHRVLKKEYDENKEWKSNSIDFEYTSKIHCVMRDFMENFGICLDNDVDFEKDLLEGNICELETLNCLKKIAGLKDIYWYNNWKGDSRAKWLSYDDRINWTNNDKYYASLFFIK